MPKFEFTLVISGLDPDDETFEDRLFEAGCKDALVSVVKGSVLLDFTREAKNFAHAVGSAIDDVQKTGARVVRIEPDSYATLSDIAERSGLTRQAVSLIVQGKRGPGDFPPPAARVGSDSPLWDWLTVSRWLRRNHKLADRRIVVQAALTRELNVLLEMRSAPLTGSGVLERVLSGSAGSGRPDEVRAAG